VSAEYVKEPEDPEPSDKASEYARDRREYWDEFAESLDHWQPWRACYQKRLTEIYQFVVPPGMRVLEIGCGQGDLLAALRPSLGVGIDFSGEMIKRASRRHPSLSFQESDVHHLNLDTTFDYVICSDLVNDLWDVQRVFERVAQHSKPSTRVIVNAYSRLWELPRRFAELVGIARRQLTQNWLTAEDLMNLLNLAGFEVVRKFSEILWPLRTPLIDSFSNRYLVKIWPLNMLALTNFIIARPQPRHSTDKEPIVSVIVPVRNEEGNIPQIFDRVPQLGAGTELVFVEGNSKDDTWGAVQREIARRPGIRVKALKQPGKGKGDAVRVGFKEASGSVFMILDADLTVPPEDLPRFYEALRSGKAEFVNGVRLVYPMEGRAMRFFNQMGNKFFSLAFSWLLSQSVKDTLCGTKVISREGYEMIAANRSYFGNFDPFGDFDLLFGAAKYNLKIVDLPIRYRERTYGETNIQRWRHGLLLIRMVLYATRRIKFV
jgi:ubiquinone/menaquinone biosynthesis C-methylase UbiE